MGPEESPRAVSGENGYGPVATVAAVAVQKAYRGYRTRRQLADSAVVAEELWWQAFEYVALNHSTVSFYNFGKHETAATRWNRVTLNASKVGRGLSQDSKAQQLIFRHWIEAIDPRHRYGHSLHLYYDEWSKAKSGQPFFYWLDVGDGKDLDLKDCPRSVLRCQCIKYLGPQERECYEYIIVDGKIKHKMTGYLLDTNKSFESEVIPHLNGIHHDVSDGEEEVKWIFVMSTQKKLYAGVKKKGKFQHSSFLAGGATLAAGRLVVEHGVLKSISPHSGHYRPSNERFDSFLKYLQEKGVNMYAVKINRKAENDPYYEHCSSNGGSIREVPLDSENSHPDIPLQQGDNILRDSIDIQQEQTQQKKHYRRTLSGGMQSPQREVHRTAVLQRINSKKMVDSIELGHQLSRKWSTGAGPRIGCVADYPAELRLQALEFVELSPRDPTRPVSFPRVSSFRSPQN